MEHHRPDHADDETKVNSADPPIDPLTDAITPAGFASVYMDFTLGKFIVCAGMALAAGLDKVGFVDGGAWVR